MLNLMALYSAQGSKKDTIKFGEANLQQSLGPIFEHLFIDILTSMF
jgi:hypothetical protein